MADREKVIKGLECCSMNLCKDGGCPYWRESKCTPFLAKDVLELIKNQHGLIKKLKNILIFKQKKIEKLESVLHDCNTCKRICKHRLSSNELPNRLRLNCFMWTDIKPLVNSEVNKDENK